jgi:hypothetical protein
MRREVKKTRYLRSPDDATGDTRGQLHAPLDRPVQAGRWHGSTECAWPKTWSMSCDQVIFVDQATGASLSSDPVIVEIDRFG